MIRHVHLDPASTEIAGITDWSDYDIDDKATKNSKNSKSKYCREYTVKQTNKRTMP